MMDILLCCLMLSLHRSGKVSNIVFFHVHFDEYQNSKNQTYSVMWPLHVRVKLACYENTGTTALDGKQANTDRTLCAVVTVSTVSESLFLAPTSSEKSRGDGVTIAYGRSLKAIKCFTDSFIVSLSESNWPSDEALESK